MFPTFERCGLGILVAALLFPGFLLGQEPPPPAVNETEAIETEPSAESNDSVPTESAAIPVADVPTLSTVLEKLSPESKKAFGTMLATDWKDRPEWSDMLIALLKGEEMTDQFGWFKASEKKYNWNWLSAKFDANTDGIISPEELTTTAANPELVFSRLDRDADGQLQFADMDYSGAQQPTPPLYMSRFLSSILDTDSNGRITLEELNTFLARADGEDGGFLTSEDLYTHFSRMFQDMNSGDDDMPDPEQMLSMFFRGELGIWEAGPKLGDEAPDFTLPTHDGSQTINLAACRGKPVILIFGSFT